MKKNLIYTALGLMGIMGALSIGVVSAVNYQNNGQIIHNEEEGTITFVYGDDSITIMDKNIGAENVGYGFDADESSYGTELLYGGEMIDIGNYTLELKHWNNNPCEEIGGYIPSYNNDWQSLLDMRGMIRLGHVGTIYGGYGLEDIEQIAEDFLIPVPNSKNYSNTKRIDLWTNQQLWPGDYFITTFCINDIDGAYDGSKIHYDYNPYYDKNSSKAYLRCFISENTKYKISYKSEGEIIHEEEIPAREKQPDKQLIRTRNKIDENNIPTPTRAGYNLTGRKTDSGEYYDFDEIVSSNITLNAEWEYVGFNVTLNPNGGDGEIKNLSGLSEVPNNQGYQRTGYIFSGWNTESNGEGICYTTGSILEANLTLYAQWTPVTYSVEFTGRDVSGNMVNQEFTYGVTGALTVNNFEKIGYTFSGWTDGTTGYVDGQEVSNLTTTSGVTIILIAEWIANTYTVKFDAGEGTGIMSDQDFTYDIAQDLTGNTFTRDGYIFSGWSDGTTGYTDKQNVINLATSGTITLMAQWKQNIPSGGSSSGGGGGGGGGRLNIKKTETSDTHGTTVTTGTMVDTGSKVDSQFEEKVEGNEDKNSNSLYEEGNGSEVLSNGYTREMNNAYTFAYKNEITIKDAIEKANMNGRLTRIQMAKMLSQYAINVLGQEPDVSKGVVKFNDVTNKMDKNYNNGVTLAYQLGIMGQNMKKNNFRPYDYVTRAEFGTALSRMLYGIEDGKGSTKYYEPHMAKLYNEGIIIKNDPKLEEKRGYVMLMLMRSAK